MRGLLAQLKVFLMKRLNPRSGAAMRGAPAFAGSSALHGHPGARTVNSLRAPSLPAGADALAHAHRATRRFGVDRQSAGANAACPGVRICPDDVDCASDSDSARPALPAVRLPHPPPLPGSGPPDDGPPDPCARLAAERSDSVGAISVPVADATAASSSLLADAASLGQSADPGDESVTDDPTLAVDAGEKLRGFGRRRRAASPCREAGPSGRRGARGDSLSPYERLRRCARGRGSVRAARGKSSRQWAPRGSARSARSARSGAHRRATGC